MLVPLLTDMDGNSEQTGEKSPIKMTLPLSNGHRIDHNKQRYPNCIVWTPIPCLTWFMPFIGHMGIATSTGVIRDFAGPYFVSEDDMAFGRPTKYWQLNPEKMRGRKGQHPKETWDSCVYEASEEYKGRMHNLCCDNCHSHCAMALNLMEYDNSNSWNMVKLCFLMLIYGKYVRFIKITAAAAFFKNKVAKDSRMIESLPSSACGKDVSVCGFLKTWLPFLIMVGGLVALLVVFT